MHLHSLLSAEFLAMVVCISCPCSIASRVCTILALHTISVLVRQQIPAAAALPHSGVLCVTVSVLVPTHMDQLCQLTESVVLPLCWCVSVCECVCRQQQHAATTPKLVSGLIG